MNNGRARIHEPGHGPGVLRLVVVRHAATTPDRDVPAAEWPLTDDPLPDGFATTLGQCERWVSSPEPKALQTARRVTDQPVEVDPRLREVERGGWIDDYDAAVARHLSSPDEPAAPGWETAAAARHRLRQWLCDLPPGGEGPVGVVTHGLAMAHLHLLLTRQAPTLRWWQDLAMPDSRTYALPQRSSPPRDAGTE